MKIRLLQGKTVATEHDYLTDFIATFQKVVDRVKVLI